MKNISINVRDWYRDAKDNDITIGSFDDILQYILDGYKTKRVGQWCVALIQAEETPPDLMPDAKDLLAGGAAAHLYLRNRLMFEQVTIQNNGDAVTHKARKTNHGGVTLREFLNEDTDTAEFKADAEVAGGSDEGDGYALIGTEQYGQNAKHRLLAVLPGSVRNCLVEMLISDMDVREAGEAFIAIVEAMMDELQPQVR